MAVVEGFSVLSDFIEHALPFIDIISEFFKYFLGVNDPQRLIIVPYLDIVFSSFEDLEDISVCTLEDFGTNFEENVIIVLFSFFFLDERTLIFVRL